MRKIISLFSCAVLLICFATTPLTAHDITDAEILGVGEYIELRMWSDMISVEYWLAFGEIEAMGYRLLMDTNQDGLVSQEESEIFLKQLVKDISGVISLELDGRKVDLELVEDYKKIDLLGEQGIKPVKVKVCLPYVHDTLDLYLTKIGEWHNISFRTKNILDKSTTLKIFINSGLEQERWVEVRYSPDEEIKIASLKKGMLVSSGQETEVKLAYRILPGAPKTPEQWKRGFFGQSEDKIKQVLLGFLSEEQLNWGIILVALFLSFCYGAAHALAPGHGKTLVAAYLIGSKGTVRDAVFLGLTVTLTHVSTVILAGVVALVASHYVSSTTLAIWLSIISGLLVILIGSWMLIKRLRSSPWTEQTDANLSAGQAGLMSHHEHHHHEHNHHEHHHYHHPPKIRLSTLIPLGISGGMIPCPAAIVVLLMAISINRIAWGLALIVAFSLGLAGILVIIGIMLVTGTSIIHRFSGTKKLIRIFSVIGPVVIIIVGLAIIFKALTGIGVISSLF